MATLAIRKGEEPPPRPPRVTATDWSAVARELRAATGEWATLGPWRSKDSAHRVARRIADDKTAIKASHVDLAPRSHTHPDGTVGSILWLRWVR